MTNLAVESMCLWIIWYRYTLVVSRLSLGCRRKYVWAKSQKVSTLNRLWGMKGGGDVATLARARGGGGGDGGGGGYWGGWPYITQAMGHCTATVETRPSCTICRFYSLQESELTQLHWRLGFKTNWCRTQYKPHSPYPISWNSRSC